MPDGSIRGIEASVRELLARHARLVLAVSGGADSAVLLDAVARLRAPHHQIIVATVDHGSGVAATEATAHALATAARHGLPAMSERLTMERPTEAAWREGRWRFLRHVANGAGAVVVTAHTRDDHVETVVMRILRGAGVRGLAGLLAPSPIERPFIGHDRKAILAYARHHDVRYVEDPSNASRAFFRNRMRLELLPAIRAAVPTFENDIMRLSIEAAELRNDVDRIADVFVKDKAPGGLITLDAEALGELSESGLRLVLPSLAARARITLDRRGLLRLESLVRSAPGTRGQLSGGFEAVRGRNDLTLVRPSHGSQSVVRLRPTGETRFDGFRFLAEPGGNIQRALKKAGNDPWRIYIPRSAEPVVRQWHPGDRLRTDLMGSKRRVKRFFADAGVVGPLRAGWPVVVCGEDVIWIPGVKGYQGAVPLEERMVQYTCERVRE